jgi:hypothetical protein
MSDVRVHRMKGDIDVRQVWGYGIVTGVGRSIHPSGRNKLYSADVVKIHLSRVPFLFFRMLCQFSGSVWVEQVLCEIWILCTCLKERCQHCTLTGTSFQDIPNGLQVRVKSNGLFVWFMDRESRHRRFGEMRLNSNILQQALGADTYLTSRYSLTSSMIRGPSLSTDTEARLCPL